MINLLSIRATRTKKKVLSPNKEFGRRGRGLHTKMVGVYMYAI